MNGVLVMSRRFESISEVLGQSFDNIVDGIEVEENAHIVLAISNDADDAELKLVSKQLIGHALFNSCDRVLIDNDNWRLKLALATNCKVHGIEPPLFLVTVHDELINDDESVNTVERITGFAEVRI